MHTPFKTQPESERAQEDLPYALELWRTDRDEAKLLLARCHSSGLAYATYYAAIRECPDERIVLLRQGQVITASRGRAD